MILLKVSNPTKFDINILNQNAIEELSKNKKSENKKDIWAYSSLGHVKKIYQRQE